MDTIGQEASLVASEPQQPLESLAKPKVHLRLLGNEAEVARQAGQCSVTDSQPIAPFFFLFILLGPRRSCRAGGNSSLNSHLQHVLLSCPCFSHCDYV